MISRAPALAAAAALTAATLAATTLVAVAPSATARPLAPPAAAAAAPTAKPWIPPGAVVTDGYVSDAISRRGGDVVLRGQFSQVGRYSGPTLVLDGATGARADAPVMDGEISVSTPDGAGGWYVGGYFSKVDAGRRQNLLHVEADGSLDPQFNVPVAGTGGVYALQLSGTTLYLAGWFDRVGGAPRRNLAAVSTATGAVAPFRHDSSQPVPEIAYAPAAGSRGARLYVSSADDLLALDATSGARVPGFEPDVAPRSRFEIAVDGDRVYLGGRGIVALDADDGSIDPTFATDGLQPAPTNQPDDAVSTLLVHDGLLYVGGDFTQLNGAPGPLAAFDLVTGAADPLFAPTVGDLGPTRESRGVYDLSVSGTGLWVGGRFGTVGGTRARNLALVDAATGARTAVTTPVPSGPVNAVDVSGDQLLVGGDFTMVDAIRALGTALLDSTTLEPIVGGTVRSRTSGDLVDGGPVVYSVRTYGGGRDVLAFDPGTGTVYGSRSHRLPRLAAATASATRLVTVQSTATRHRFGPLTVSVFSNDSGKRLRSFRMPYPGYVTDTRLDGHTLLVSGSFRRQRPGTGEQADLAVLALDVRTGRVHQGFDPHLNGPVYAMTPAGSPLVVTGLFNRSHPRRPSAGQVHRGIALLDQHTGTTTKVFTGAVRYGAERVLVPFSEQILMHHPIYSTDATYVRFDNGVRAPDPTGGYGAHATEFFSLVESRTGFLGDTGYDEQQFVAAVPD